MNYIDLSSSKMEPELITSNIEITLPYGELYQNKDIDAVYGYNKQIEYCLKVLTKNMQTGHINAQNFKIDNDDIVYCLTVFNEPLNNVLYEPLTSLGIYSTIQIAVSTKYDRMYLDPKLLNKLNSMSSKTKKSIIMYFFTLLNLLVKGYINTKNEFGSPAFDILSNTYENAYIYKQILDDNLFNFKNINSFNLELCDISKINKIDNMYLFSFYKEYNCIKFGNTLNNKYVGIQMTNTTTGEIHYGILLINDLNKNYNLINSFEKTIYTNKELNLFDLDGDSVLANIVNKLKSSILNVKNENDLLEEYTNIVLIDQEELSNLENKDILDFLETYSEGYIVNTKVVNEVCPFIKQNETSLSNEVIKDKYKDDEYAQKLYQQVFPYYDTFDLKDLTKCVKGLQKGDIYSMLLIGESGTGKSTAARVLAYKSGIPYISINLSANTEETDLFGTMIPNPNKNKPEDPEFIWKDGLITRAVKNGYIIILEEINFARPSVLGKLNSLLDETKQIELPTGDLIKAHPNFRVIATCNIAYEGTNRFNKALVNRFEIVKKFTELEDSAIVKIITERTGYSDLNKINKIIQVYRSIKKFSENNNLDLVISVRQLLTFFKQYKFYRTTKDAVLNTLVHNAFIEDPEYEERFIEEILAAIDLKFVL